MDQKGKIKGIQAAASSALFLGMAPIFGKLAILFGFNPLAVVAFRTGIAFILLFIIVLIFYRQFLYIFPVGLLGEHRKIILVDGFVASRILSASRLKSLSSVTSR